MSAFRRILVIVLACILFVSSIICVNYCFHAGIKRKQSNFQRQIICSVDPVKLQGWATEIINTNHIGHWLTESELNEYYQLTNKPVSAYVCAFADIEGKCLFLNWNYFYGQLGMVVGDTNFVLNDMPDLHLVLWHPGIYFYQEYGH